MADLSWLLANAGQTNADFDLGKINKSYWEGRDQYAKNDLRDAFKGGIPLTPDGQPDIKAIANTLFQKGDIAGGAGLLPGIAGQQDRQLFYGGGSGPQAASAPPIVSPPSMNRPAQAKVAPELNKGGEVQGGSQAGSQPQGDQPGSIVGLVSSSGIPDELAGPVIAQVSAMTKMDPNVSLDPSIAPRIQQVVQAAAQRLRAGQPPQPTGLQPGSTAPIVPMPVATQNIQPQSQLEQGPQSTPSLKDALEIRKLRYLSGSPDKGVAAAAQEELKALNARLAPTPEMKNAAASGQNLPAYQEKQGELAAQQAGATERAKADVTEQRAYIDNGKMAGTRIGTLNALQNIINTDKNLNLGFGSETTLKIKMALQQAGFDFGDLSGAQLIQKFGAALASESTKALATRPTQFEFKTFLANNPGLLLDEKGNIRMIGIMSQNAKREYELGKLARKNQDNWDNWDNVVEAYDKKFPIKDPTTGKALSNNSIIAPGPTKQQQTSPALEPGKTSVGGYTYKGGNPKDKANWELRS